MTNKPQFVGEYRRVKLGEICSKGKSSLRQKDVFDDGPYTVYGASGIVGTMSVYQNEAPYVAVVKDGAGVGRANACEPMTSVLGTMQALIPNSDVDRDYLLHLVRSLHLGRGFSGSTIPHIYFRDYGKIEVPLPSIDVQKRIVFELGSVEAQIAQAEAQIKQLDSLVKSRFVEMFEHGQEWELRALAECCATSDDIKCGPFGSQLHKEDYISEGVPVWGIPEINSSFEHMPDKYVSTENGQRLQSYSLVPGDIAMNRKGNVGQAALFDGKRPSGIIHSDVLRVRVDQDVLNPAFLVEQLHTSHVVREEIMTASTGAIMAGTNVTKLKKIKVFVPPLDLQQEFASFVSQIDKSRFVAQQQIEKLQMLYDKLAQDYFG